MAFIFHSALIMNLIKLKGTAKLTEQGEGVCLKDSKYILFEILANRTWKGCTSSCQSSKPDLAIWLARPAGVCTALPCPLCQDLKQNIFGILEAYPFTLRSQFCCPFNFIRFLISALCMETQILLLKKLSEIIIQVFLLI